MVLAPKREDPKVRLTTQISKGQEERVLEVGTEDKAWGTSEDFTASGQCLPSELHCGIATVPVQKPTATTSSGSPPVTTSRWRQGGAAVDPTSHAGKGRGPSSSLL